MLETKKKKKKTCLDMTLSKEMRRLGSGGRGGRWGLSQAVKRGMTGEK